MPTERGPDRKSKDNAETQSAQRSDEVGKNAGRVVIVVMVSGKCDLNPHPPETRRVRHPTAGSRRGDRADMGRSVVRPYKSIGDARIIDGG